MKYDILVNKSHPLSKDYIPKDLIIVNDKTGDKLDKSYVNRVNKKVYHFFKLMQKDALKLGYKVYIDSSYRPYAYQEKIFIDTLKNLGIKHALKYVANAGISEHQTGLAIDIIIEKKGVMCENITGCEDELKWLFNNAHRYGFILRYPEGKEKYTGINFEPWHYRFVGKKLAKKLKNCNLTLEEYYINRKK